MELFRLDEDGKFLKEGLPYPKVHWSFSFEKSPINPDYLFVRISKNSYDITGVSSFSYKRGIKNHKVIWSEVKGLIDDMTPEGVRFTIDKFVKNMAFV